MNVDYDGKCENAIEDSRALNIKYKIFFLYCLYEIFICGALIDNITLANRKTLDIWFFLNKLIKF